MTDSNASRRGSPAPLTVRREPEAGAQVPHRPRQSRRRASTAHVSRSGAVPSQQFRYDRGVMGRYTATGALLWGALALGCGASVRTTVDGRADAASSMDG